MFDQLVANVDLLGFINQGIRDVIVVVKQITDAQDCRVVTTLE